VADSSPTGEPAREKPRLRYKSGAAGDVCPRCGEGLEDGAVLCTYCGLDLRTGRIATAAKKVSRDWTRFLRTLLRTSGLLILLVLIYLCRAELGQRFEQTGSFLRRHYYAWTLEKPKAIERPTACASCEGAGQITCPICGGFGSVELERRSKCEQCGGSGRYKRKMGPSKSSGAECPFCSGRGYSPSSAFESCKDCAGTGNMACSACGGTGSQPPAR
jgi:hypothetical protein